MATVIKGFNYVAKDRTVKMVSNATSGGSGGSGGGTPPPTVGQTWPRHQKN